ncbi:MAG: hypothetical protein PHH17_01395 [Candidatus Pacebacteria bacterium]|jgi:hypothetical protein|nr:hypothetical protein [Candidatus Paceibacterota bacterium]MDD3728979.1 hypothetical protein [Candidatus Paceibacterota bacterium]MDD4201651.1 hypothetical protein [Candidatus Paceibacterota bacterium]MDD4467050.1 hypothetical protein [Candidatus Paceibacterota bacterium]MDD5445848.1 hypothetical protein [Candidatus Paceibacterota bacterium]
MDNFFKLERSKKFWIVFSLIIRIILIVAIVASVIENNWIFVFFSALTFFLTFFPKIIERSYKIELPAEFQVLIVLFAYAGVFLGGVGEFYVKFWWWDSMLHFLAGIGLGFIGFLILYVLYKNNKFKASHGTIAIFAFCFALSLGVLWEIFEFSVDSLFGENMQRARDLCDLEYFCDSRLGVIDTMIDLILDAMGALIASFSSYLYLKRKEIPIFNRMIKRFEEENPSLFKEN